MPEIVRTFSDPIRIPCRIVWRTKPRSAAADPLTPGEGADRQLGPSAPIREPGGRAPTAPLAEKEATSPGLTGAAGAALALGSTAALPAEVLAGLSPVGQALLVGTVTVAAAVAMLKYLAAMTGDRNAGQPSPLRANAQRARTAAMATNPELERLRREDWNAHHLISVKPAQRYPTLLEAAARAGWRMDAPGNVIGLPRTPEAQAKLAAAGIHLPLHDNAHPTWNSEINAELQEIERELHRSNSNSASEDYAARARAMLEEFQNRLRLKALPMNWIVQMDGVTQTTVS